MTRYDGNRFVVFKSDAGDSTGLSNDNITGIQEDVSKNLWIATAGGLHRYDRTKGTFVRYARKNGDGNEAALNRIEMMALDRRDDIWLLTADGGITTFNSHTGIFKKFVHNPKDSRSLSSDAVRAVHAGRSGKLWIATSTGLDVFAPENDSFEHITSGRSQDTLLNKINAILETRDGSVWLGIRGAGLARFQPGAKRLQLYRTNSRKGKRNAPSLVGTLWEDDSSRLWIGSAYEGFFIFDPKTEKFDQYEYTHNNPKSLVGLTVTCFMQDRSSLLWVGTESALNLYDPRKPFFSNISFDFHDNRYREHNDVWSIHEERNEILWVGTNGTVRDPGLIRLERVSGAFRHVKPPDENRFVPNVFSIQRDQSGNLWLGSYGEGVYTLNPQTLEFHDALNGFPAIPRADHFVRSLMLDHAGKTWVGWRTAGLMKLDYAERTAVSFRNDSLKNSLSVDAVVTMYEDRDHIIWVGTVLGGLNRLNPVTGEFSTYKHQDNDTASLSHDIVLSIYEDRRGNLWVGTSSGLNKMNKTSGTFARYSEKDGLIGRTILGILEDRKGNLWLSTQKALIRFNDELPPARRARAFDFDDGIRNTEFNKESCYQCTHGEFFFGGKEGITSFFPEQVLDNPVPPAVVLTGFRIAGKETALATRIEECNSVEVLHRDNVLTFEFAALEFSNPSKNRYAYKMEGFDEDWNHVGTQRSATYTNLDPGEYTFRVKASNNDGVWNEAGTSVALVVLPPYWMAWWFRSIAIVLFLSVGPIIYFRRVTQLKKANLLREEFSRQLIESQEQERKRIAAELHDSLGQNIMIMKNRALMGLHPGQKQEEIRTHLSEISSVASQSLDEARRIAYNLRPYQLDRFGLTEAIRSMLEEVSGASSIKYQCDVEEIDGLFPKELEINLYRIVQESVNNIVRHSGALSARVYIRTRGSVLEIEIQDDGKGIQMQRQAGTMEQKNGFGLIGLRERVNMLGGTFVLESAPGQGTKIGISIPVKQ